MCESGARDHQIAEIRDELYKLWYSARELDDKAGLYFLEMAILHFGGSPKPNGTQDTATIWRELKGTIEGR